MMNTNRANVSMASVHATVGMPRGFALALFEDAIGHRKNKAVTGYGSARRISTQTLTRLESQSKSRNGSDEPHSSADGQLL